MIILAPAGGLVAAADFYHPQRITTIAFGSDAEQDKPQAVWAAVNEIAPDVFIFAGDNVFGDTQDMMELRSAYSQLGMKEGYQALQVQSEVLAIWDDHDLGENDAYGDFPYKVQSEAEFLRFFDAEKVSPRARRPGLYESHLFGPDGERVQIILLDTRYFRSRMEPFPPDERHPFGGYLNDSSPDRSMLGEAQWLWLEEQLSDPAEVRFVVSSIQVIPEEHPFEAWARFPLERKRLFELISRSAPDNIVLLSGDRNLGEISLLPEEDELSPGYPLFELTSSPLTQLFPPTGGHWSEEPNKHRVSDGNFRFVNFGFVTIDWDRDERTLALELRNEQGATVFRQVLPINH